MRGLLVAGALLAVGLQSCTAAGASRPRAQEDYREDDPDAPVPNLALHGRQVNFGVGVRSFEDPDFGKLDDQLATTLDYIEPMGLGALRLEGGMHFTYDETDGRFQGQDVRLKGQDFELSLGLNYATLLGRMRPYVGFGLGIQFLNLRGIDDEHNIEFDDKDTSVGGYLKAGILLQVTRAAHVGFEVRHLEGSDVTFDGVQIGTSYDQILLVFGTSFAPEEVRHY